VMYAGRIVEQGAVVDVFSRPLHPYTQALLRSIPRLRKHRGEKKEKRLQAISGSVPHPTQVLAGCAFAPRCGQARDQCASAAPALSSVETRLVRCWLYSDTVAPDAPLRSRAPAAGDSGVSLTP
jgi:oligopeptide/dipeptide ABC transporter ATP-binding protein